MRIRSIKPEFWRSDDVNAMRIEDRLLFIGLWSYVDDNGVGIDRHADVCADLFAHDLSVSPHDTLMRVQAGLDRLAQLGVIHRYEVRGKRFLEIANWSKHQKINRPSPGRYPRSDHDEAVIHDVLTESSVSDPDSSCPGAGEQGNRGTGEQEDLLSSADAPDETPTAGHPYSQDFLAWWKHYPRKESKGAAFKAWKQIKDRHLPTLIAAADRYAADPNREPRFTKLPASWLNARAWEDETPLPPRSNRPDSTARIADIDKLKRGRSAHQWNGMTRLTS